MRPEFLQPNRLRSSQNVNLQVARIVRSCRNHRPSTSAEPHCPGNVASVPLHLTNSHQMIVAVSVNHSGPYNFLLDTGTTGNSCTFL